MTNRRPDAARDLERSPRARPPERSGPSTTPPVHAPSLADVQRAVDSPATAEPADILALQKSHGNRAVSGLLAGRVQAKLMVGPADDAYEREADHFADLVVAAPAIARQPQGLDEDETAQPKASVQREMTLEEEGLAQAKFIPGTRVQREVDLDEDEVEVGRPTPALEEDEDLAQAKPLDRPVQRELALDDEEDKLAQRATLLDEDEEMAQAKPLAAGATPFVQRASTEAGFEAEPDVEHRLRVHRGGGRPLPNGTRDFMERRFGADFGPVRVHTGTGAVQLNRDLQAQAFTHGSDIYFNAGNFNPATKGGQHLLAHELTHVIQQGGAGNVRTLRRASVQRAWQRQARRGGLDRLAPPPGARAASLAVSRATPGLQRKRGLVSMKTNTRDWRGPRTDNLDADAKAVEKARKGPQFTKLETVDLYDSPQAHISDSSGAILWKRIKSGKGANQYIKSSKLMEGIEPGQSPGTEPGDMGTSKVGSFVDATTFTGGLVGKTDDMLFEMVRDQSMQGTLSSGLNIAEGATWGGASLLGMASALRDLADDEKSAWDKVSAYFTLVGSMVGAAGGSAQIASSLLQSGSTSASQASTTSAFLLGYQDMFSGLANAVKTIKGVVDLIKMVINDKKYSAGQYVNTGGELLTAGLETAKSTLRAIRHINEALSGSVGTQFQQLIPGLDIAIAAVKSITQGYYLAVSAVELSRMHKRKLELNQALVDQGYTPDQVKSTGKQFRTEEAMSAKLAQMVAEKQAKIDAAQKKHDKIKLEGTPQQQAKAREKRRVLAEKIAALKVKKQAYQDRLDEHTQRVQEAEAESEGPSRGEMEERELASDLAVANKRRVTRQAVHIAMNLVQIAGSIASIVSGPGAPAALALKLSAAGVDASLPFFRWIKQRGRDAAARNRAKGQTGLSNKIFNADKSDAAKLTARKKQAVLILTMVARLHPMIPAPDADDYDERVTRLKAQAGRVEGYIRASGCPPEKLYAANGKPDKQVGILVEELARRELG